MRPVTRPETARPGFTLVELMVAMALCVLIMAILAGAFQVGLDTMSQLKSAAGLSEQLRSATAVMSRDLAAPHLEDEWGRSVKLSHPDVQRQAWTGTAQKRGFVKVRQVSPIMQDFNPLLPSPPNPPYASPTLYPNGYPFVYEGTDPDGVPSYRATDHVLHLTSRLTGVDADQVYSGLAPNLNPTAGPGDLVNTAMNRHDLRVGNQFVSQWAEIVYFLTPSGLATTGDEATGTRPLALYTLHRRQRVLTPSPFAFIPALDQNQYPAVSVPPTAGTPTNDPLAITTPTNRLNSDNPASLAIAGTSPEYGSDILLSNVLSFQIRLQFEGQPGFADEWMTSVAGQRARTEPPGFATTDKPRVYDTADDPTSYLPTTGSPPPPRKPRVRAIQIKLRVYDPNNKMTRQVTLIQDV
jgi:prepilin-type N-terminal cleavage/methylation domain-containing protein